MLTDKEISNADAKDKAYRLTDGAGLYLEVSPAGGKLWRLKYRFAGKEKRLSIGKYPEVKAPAARARATEAKTKLSNGIDPSAEKKAIKVAALVASGNTFEIVAREWHEKRLSKLSDTHAKQIIGTLEREVFPLIGDRPVSSIEAPDLLVALRQIEKRGAFEIARKTRQWAGMVFRYAIATGRAKHNPAPDLQGALETQVTKHHAAFDRAGLAEFLRKIEQYDGTEQTRLALLLLASTFVRTGELRFAAKSEFDLPGQTWRIPAERMKTRAPHVVPLSSQAVALVEQLFVIAGDSDLLLPGANTKSKPISENTLLYALYRMGYHGRATGHGFRATASTLLNEMGWKPDVIERQLAHQERNKVRAAYHRSEYLQDRRQMMQAWSDFLDALRAGAEVIPFAKKASN
jgi:integrase